MSPERAGTGAARSLRADRLRRIFDDGEPELVRERDEILHGRHLPIEIDRH